MKSTAFKDRKEDSLRGSDDQEHQRSHGRDRQKKLSHVPFGASNTTPDISPLNESTAPQESFNAGVCSCIKSSKNVSAGHRAGGSTVPSCNLWYIQAIVPTRAHLL